MEIVEIREKITTLESEAASIVLKMRAIQLTGGVGGVFVAKEKKILGKIGFFLLGAVLGGVASTMVYSKRLTQILGEIENLEAQIEVKLTNPNT
ncbi:hypothetical protein [Flavobacterium sp. J27]|uniref:hypothetical protein n=1 Tax=Flavobacterium sp. J27 TaxID=2060419 RepID=UPI00102FE206|nr:hypothetical protein [Flavobacterium sp. J27]